MGLAALGIYKSYGPQRVLSGVDLCIEPGEICLLVGPSGSGKTTLLRILSLLEKPDGGVISLDGQTFSYLPVTGHAAWTVNESYRRRVTMVFQQLFMWPHIPMKTAIELTASGTFDLDRLASRLEVADVLGRFPNEVSLGQRQRVAILRAISTNADYYFLDEITSALDKRMSSEVVSLIRDLQERGKGIVLVTHSPERFTSLRTRSISITGEVS